MVENGTKLKIIQTNTIGLAHSIISEYGNESLIIDVSGSGIYLGNNDTSIIRLSPSLDHTHDNHVTKEEFDTTIGDIGVLLDKINGEVI